MPDGIVPGRIKPPETVLGAGVMITGQATDRPSEVQALFVAGPPGLNGKEVWIPTAYSRGPWSPDSLHGGPIAALFVRAAERVPAPVDVRLSRLTVELLGPVPFVPLVIESELLRSGKKVSTIQMTLRTADGEEGSRVLAAARAQRIRKVDLRFPDGAIDHVPDFPDESTPIPHWPGAADVTFHANAVEHRFVFGAFNEAGPSMDWMRLRVPVVGGEVPTGWQTAAAFSDFTNGLSSVAPFDGASMFINPDLTVSLWREPEGEWICSHAETRTSDTGIGMSQALLWDRSGRCGVGMQSLYLDRIG